MQLGTIDLMADHFAVLDWILESRHYIILKKLMDQGKLVAPEPVLLQFCQKALVKGYSEYALPVIDQLSHPAHDYYLLLRIALRTQQSNVVKKLIEDQENKSYIQEHPLAILNVIRDETSLTTLFPLLSHQVHMAVIMAAHLGFENFVFKHLSLGVYHRCCLAAIVGFQNDLFFKLTNHPFALKKFDPADCLITAIKSENQEIFHHLLSVPDPFPDQGIMAVTVALSIGSPFGQTILQDPRVDATVNNNQILKNLVLDPFGMSNILMLLKCSRVDPSLNDCEIIFMSMKYHRGDIHLRTRLLLNQPSVREKLDEIKFFETALRDPSFSGDWVDMYLGRPEPKNPQAILKLICQYRNAHVLEKVAKDRRFGLPLMPRLFDYAFDTDYFTTEHPPHPRFY